MTEHLDKTKILTTVSRQILFNCLLKGMSIKDASHQAKLNYIYARKVATKGNINALVAQTMAKISAKSEIKVELVQHELHETAQLAKECGEYAAAGGCYATLLKSIGGMTGDRPHPDAMAGKMLDSKRIEDIRAIADIYYNRRYLATDEPAVLDFRPLAGPGGDDNSQKDIQTGDMDNGTNSSRESEALP